MTTSHPMKLSVHTGWCLGCTGCIIWPVSQWQLGAIGSSQLLFLLQLPRFLLLLLTLPLLCVFGKQFTNIRLLLLLLLPRLIFIHLSKHHKNALINSSHSISNQAEIRHIIYTARLQRILIFKHAHMGVYTIDTLSVVYLKHSQYQCND